MKYKASMTLETAFVETNYYIITELKDPTRTIA